MTNHLYDSITATKMTRVSRLIVGVRKNIHLLYRMNYLSTMMTILRDHPHLLQMDDALASSIRRIIDDYRAELEDMDDTTREILSATNGHGDHILPNAEFAYQYILEVKNKMEDVARFFRAY